MNSVLKWVCGLVGCIVLAFFFPFIREVFDVAAGNSTNPGMLYLVGTDALGDPIYESSRNVSLIRFTPYLFPVVFFVAIIIYVVTTRGSKPE